MENEVTKSFRRLLLTLFVIHFLTLLGMVSAFVGLTIYNKTQLAQILADSARNSLIVRDWRQAITNLERPTETQFKAFGFFDQSGFLAFSLPANSPTQIFTQIPFWNSSIVLPVSLGVDGKNESGTLHFIYGPFDLVPYGFMLWLLVLLASAPFVKSARRKITIQHEKELKREKAEALGSLARQVAHDVRSPLAALLAVSKSSNEINEDDRILVKSAVTSITDIANNLLAQNLPESYERIGNAAEKPAPLSEGTQPEILSALIESAVSQKRAEVANRPGIEVSEAASDQFGACARVNALEFKRVLSNLMNNSVEALADSVGQVKIALSLDSSSVRVEVLDSGIGMTPEVLDRLGTVPFSSRKRGMRDAGYGLGVSHAKKAIEGWGGRLEYRSTVGKGTVATVILPKAPLPEWFVSELDFSKTTDLIVLDDDPNIHEIWLQRIQQSPSRIVSHHCRTSEEVLSWYRDHAGSEGHPFYLFDFELGREKITGLDLIEMLGIANRSVLVTSHWQEVDLQRRCKVLGVSILPKSIAPLVPLSGL